MERLARLVIRHRRIVFGLWIVLFLAGGFAAGKVPDRLGIDFSLPGQPGDTAEKHLVEAYGTSSYDTFVAVVTVPEGQTVEANKDQIAKVFSRAPARSSRRSGWSTWPAPATRPSSRTTTARRSP